jgi:regulator of sigma E protease
MTILYAILIFCLLIFVHELGHLIAAKAAGVRVNEFALGMGPLLFKFKKGETDYSLRLLPIGGFCAMEGEDENSDDPRAFNRKPLPAKALVLVAGSLMNLIVAVLILSAVAFSYGAPSMIIAEVGADSPAAAAGLAEGDRILSVDGAAVEEWEDFSEAVQNARGNSAQIVVSRNGERLDLESGFYTGEDGVKRIGVISHRTRSAANLGPSLIMGFEATWYMGVSMVRIIGQIFTGLVSVKELTGPVGIVQVVVEVAKNGPAQLAQLTALISLNLGVVNLLPIPALDGGRFVFLFVRKLTGKAVSDEMEGKIHLVGIMLLCALMIFVTFQDVSRIFFTD